MDLAFPWPYSPGEWLAWASAVCTILLGLAALLAPRVALRALGVPASEKSSGARGILRAQVGGFYIGIGITAILFAQPLIYLALGMAWAIAALGRLVSMAADGGGMDAQVPGFLLAVLFAGLPLAFALGFVP